MSKASDAGNAVVYAAAQVCDLYGVQYTREQSRVLNVQGTAGRWRPMYFGQWTDQYGHLHKGGKADLLARPRICVDTGVIDILAKYIPTYRSIPLWIECKAGKGRLNPDQIAFKSWVELNGDAYLLIHDDVRPLIAWFDANGVSRDNKPSTKYVTEPINSQLVNDLPCRHCAAKRDDHEGPYRGCKGKRNTVWSPDLKAAK